MKNGITKTMTGKFITFEGIEGSGKTTAARYLHEYLTKKGIETVFTSASASEHGTDFSRRVRAFFMEEEGMQPLHPAILAMFYMIARKDAVEHVIAPALKAGKWVICDRFDDSTMAYQGYGANNEYMIKNFYKLSDFALEGLKPDLTFFIDIPVDVSRQRIAQKTLDAMEKKVDAFFERARKGFQAIAKDEPNRMITIDGTMSIIDVQKALVSELGKKVKI